MDLAIPTSAHFIPNRTLLPNPNTPWLMSQEVFQRVQLTNSTGSYKKCEITSKDPEWKFVFQYFEMQKPENRHIGRVYCIHNPDATRSFESPIPDLERECQQPIFAPKWRGEPESALRQKVHDRWKEMAALFSPFVIRMADQRDDTYRNVKILPLWHGTKAPICDSI